MSSLPEFLRGAFLENTGLKTFAFVLALGLFAYVHGQEVQQERTIPVSVISLPPEDGARVLTTPLPPSIHITLRGPSRAMTRLIQDGATPVEVDLRDGRREAVTFGRNMFVLPDELELIVAEPPRLELRWEDVVTRQIPLQASITGKPAEGHVVKGEPELEPHMVTVKGAQSRVEVMQFARLAPFDISGLAEGRYPRRLAMDAPPNQVRFLGSQAATVTVEIARRRSEKLFAARTVEVIGPPHAVVVPRTVDIMVIGAPDSVRAFREELVVPQANLTLHGLWTKDMPHGSVTVPVTVSLAGAQAEAQPPFVTVKW